jgi:ribosomal protein S11
MIKNFKEFNESKDVHGGINFGDINIQANIDNNDIITFKSEMTNLLNNIKGCTVKFKGRKTSNLRAQVTVDRQQNTTEKAANAFIKQTNDLFKLTSQDEDWFANYIHFDVEDEDEKLEFKFEYK